MKGLIEYISAHGHTAYPTEDGHICAVEEWWKDGKEFQSTVILPANWHSVRVWLGY